MKNNNIDNVKLGAVVNWKRAELAHEFAKDFAKLMELFDKGRAALIDTFGDDDGFNEWFSNKLGLTK